MGDHLRCQNQLGLGEVGMAGGQMWKIQHPKRRTFYYQYLVHHIVAAQGGVGQVLGVAIIESLSACQCKMKVYIPEEQESFRVKH